jgi:hypothetical protein
MPHCFRVPWRLASAHGPPPPQPHPRRALTAGDHAELSVLRLLEDGLSDQLGPWPLRRFSGEYDDGANPVWTPGPLLADTVYRFTGQSAPAVVLTECDFAQWDDRIRRLLFVGLTRARVHLEWAVSERAGEVLAGAV